MDSRLTQAEATAATLQRAAGTSVPVLIPGALDMRVGRPTARPNGASLQPVAPHARAAAVAGDRERLEREREGGGAPSERLAGPRTIFARLYDLLVGRHHAP